MSDKGHATGAERVRRADGGSPHQEWGNRISKPPARMSRLSPVRPCHFGAVEIGLSPCDPSLTLWSDPGRLSESALACERHTPLQEARTVSRMTRLTTGSTSCRRAATALFAAALLGLVPACSFNKPPPGGDPGNRRLYTLSADPIFRVLPPDAHMVGTIVRTPARYSQPGFGGGGWHGPGVTLTFTSSQPSTSVFSYYANLAPSFAWIATGSRNVVGYPQVWDKQYPGIAQARLSLVDIDLGKASPGATQRYTLIGSA